MLSKQQNKNLLFIYGSLKRGFDNHQLLKNAPFIAEAKTLFNVCRDSWTVPIFAKK